MYCRLMLLCFSCAKLYSVYNEIGSNARYCSVECNTRVYTVSDYRERRGAGGLEAFAYPCSSPTVLSQARTTTGSAALTPTYTLRLMERTTVIHLVIEDTYTHARNWLFAFLEARGIGQTLTLSWFPHFPPGLTDVRCVLRSHAHRDTVGGHTHVPARARSTQAGRAVLASSRDHTSRPEEPERPTKLRRKNGGQDGQNL